jgi:hypothetical protein
MAPVSKVRPFPPRHLGLNGSCLGTLALPTLTHLSFRRHVLSRSASATPPTLLTRQLRPLQTIDPVRISIGEAEAGIIGSI